MSRRLDSSATIPCTRRAVLGTAGVVGLASLTGCLGVFGQDSEPAADATDSESTSEAAQDVGDSTNATPQPAERTPQQWGDSSPLYKRGPVESRYTGRLPEDADLFPDSIGGRGLEDVTFEVFRTVYDPEGADAVNQPRHFERVEDRFRYLGSVFTKYECDRFEFQHVLVSGMRALVIVRLRPESGSECRDTAGEYGLDWRHDFRVSGRFVGPNPESLHITVRNREYNAGISREF